MSKLTDAHPVGEAVRVTYEWEGEFYFFDGEVTNEESPYRKHMGRHAIGQVLQWDNMMVQNVYLTDKVESLESLHTPKDS